MYQVLARKYRPRNFIELVGQNHVSRALTSALERGRLHHAYLFTGTRGVGKTTIARILAKCLNCETGITSTPCEVCATCTAVNEGRFIDLIEIDAASRTKVEDTRELLDNVPYAPTQGRFKVYLIDEVHMLSTHSFNALLKTLEEPPEHVKFLFATTDPQKLPITVISRCLQFTLRPLAVDEITSHLTDILSKEDIAAEQDAIWQIAESAQGSLRDALSLTDQAIAYGQGAIKHQDVKEMLGLIDRTIIFDLILAIHQNQQQRVSQLLMQFRQQALDVSLVLDQFISTLHELALLQYLPDLSLKYSAEINAKIMQLSALISAQDLQLYYQVACKGRTDLQLAVTQEQGFEMTVLRLLAFRPLQVNEVAMHPVSASAPQAVISASTATIDSQSNAVVTVSEHNRLDAQQSVVSIESVTPDITQDAPNSVATTTINRDAHFADPAFDSDDTGDVDEEFAMGSQQHIAHEPSSDDFLDDEIEPNLVAPTGGRSASRNDEVSYSDQATQAEPQSEPKQNSQLEVGLNDAPLSDAEPSLSLFGDAPAAQPEVQSTAEVEDIFFLNPEHVESAEHETANISSSELQPNLDSAISNESMNEAVQDDVMQRLNALAAQATVTQAVKPNSTLSDGLMPQDILKLAPQVMEGEWSIDKWEFWFRNSELSPAVQELAQQGLMTGQIDGESIFNIPQKYETLLSQFQDTLEAELKKHWSNTRFSVQYQDVSGATPYDQQVLRKERAYERAAELLQNEDAVKGLIHSFGADLHNIQLKS